MNSLEVVTLLLLLETRTITMEVAQEEEEEEDRAPMMICLMIIGQGTRVENGGGFFALGDKTRPRRLQQSLLKMLFPIWPV